MLKNISVFVSHCNSHVIPSFPRQCRLSIKYFGTAPAVAAGHVRFPASCRFLCAARGLRPLAELIMTALNQQLLAVDDTVCELKARAFVNLCHSSPRNLHLPRGFLMRLFLQIYQPNRFKLIHRQNDSLRRRNTVRAKTDIVRFSAYDSFSLRSRHDAPSFFRKAAAPASRMVDTICSFPSYVDYSTDFKKSKQIFRFFQRSFARIFDSCLKIEVFSFLETASLSL